MWASMRLAKIHVAAVPWSSSLGLTKWGSLPGCSGSTLKTPEWNGYHSQPVTSRLYTVEKRPQATELCLVQSIWQSTLVWSVFSTAMLLGVRQWINKQMNDTFLQHVNQFVDLWYLLTAFSDGVSFFRSANNVILCPGDDRGFLRPQYFKAVFQRRPRMYKIVLSWSLNSLFNVAAQYTYWIFLEYLCGSVAVCLQYFTCLLELYVT